MNENHFIASELETKFKTQSQEKTKHFRMRFESQKIKNSPWNNFNVTRRWSKFRGKGLDRVDTGESGDGTGESGWNGVVGETGCLGESLPTPLFPAFEKGI